MAHSVVATGEALVFPVGYKTAQKQIQLAIVIIVKPNRRSRPALGKLWDIQASLSRDIGKRTIAIVLQQCKRPVGRDQDIREAIVIEIADRHTLSGGCK